MPETNVCPSCGSPLTANEAQGLCPRCLLKRGMEQPTAGFTESGQPAPRWEPPAPTDLSAQFPDVEVIELLGRGGMGAVYKARQKQLDRVVALKILPPDIGNDPAFAERFTREAKALARLNHPNIVTLYEFGRTNAGLFYFLMEYVDGVNLRRLMEAGRMAPREALAIVPQVCDALQYAHDNGIVHRDIKPENILLDRRGRVKVADFGLAKIIGQDEQIARMGGGIATTTTITEAGKVVGTPQYMAPEQADNPSAVDHRADIYALGVVFYQMLTGELPDRALEPPSWKVKIDVRLDEVVLRALERNPAMRYAQAGAMKTEVETISSTPPQANDLSRANRPLFFMGIPLVKLVDGKSSVSWNGLSTVWLIAFGIASSVAFAMWVVTKGMIPLGRTLILEMLSTTVFVAAGYWKVRRRQQPIAPAMTAMPPSIVEGARSRPSRFRGIFSLRNAAITCFALAVICATAGPFILDSMFPIEYESICVLQVSPPPSTRANIQLAAITALENQFRSAHPEASFNSPQNNLVEVTVTQKSPEGAAGRANALAAEFKARLQKETGYDVGMVQSPETPPEGPKYPFLGIGLTVSFLFCVLGALLVIIARLRRWMHERDAFVRLRNARELLRNDEPLGPDEKPLLHLEGILKFRSPVALNVARFAFLGGCLGFLGYLHSVPGWEPAKRLFGLFGFFGLAYLIEWFARFGGILPRNGLQKPETEEISIQPRFSRTAIVGALWASLFFVLLFLWFA